MNTFEITVQRKIEEGWPVVAEQSRTGSFLPVRSEGLLLVDPEELLALLDPHDYGVRLGQELFTDSIRDAFTRALADSNNDLRVLLFIEADDLRILRWERLCAPLTGAWDFLALDQQVLFSLYLPSVTDSRFPAIGRRDLRALVVAASPDGLERYGLSHFDLPNAIASATESLGEIPFDVLASGPGLAEHPTITPVGPASLDAIAARLIQEKYTLLHIVGHGRYSSRNGETSLFLADNAGSLGRVTASEMIARLGDLGSARTLPHFTFLSTCESAVPEAEGALGGLGQRLVRDLGMPAVVAMTEKISVSTALALAKAFYHQLRQHGEVDRALVEANAGIAGAADATVPALYSRLGGRPLFSDLLAQDRALTAAEIHHGLTQLDEQLPVRGPVLGQQLDASVKKLRATLGVAKSSLSPALRKENAAQLKQIDTICNDLLDISFKALALGQQPPGYDERCPYLGLAAFHTENHPFFFGREPLTAHLTKRLDEGDFLAVLGGSGSGKSSLVLAGMVPALQSQNPNLIVRYLTPTDNPVAQLDRILTESVDEGIDESTDESQLIVADQFEELFTLCTDEAQRQRFVDQLLSQLTQKGCKIVLTMRADFWGECAAFPQLRDLMQAHQELVSPMNAQELRSSMEQQARLVGLRFEADLSNTILDDVRGEPGAMPLLQHALLELWKRRHGRWLRADEYRALGGVQQAIARTADSIYRELDDGDRGRMRAILLRLTRIDDGQGDEEQRDTRRRARLDELAADGDEVAVHGLVQRLADARLVVTSEGDVEVTHEALIRHWPRLRSWLAEDRTALHLRQSIGTDAAEWEAGGRADSLLPRWNMHLEETQRLAQNPRFALNQLERTFLDACIALRDREAAAKEAQRQRELEQAQALAAEQRQRAEEQEAAASRLRRRAFLLAAIGVVAVLLAVTAGWFSVQSNRNEALAKENEGKAQAAQAVAESNASLAETREAEAQSERTKAEAQARLAQSSELAAAALNNLTTDPELSLLLADQAIEVTYTVQAENALHQALQASRLLLTLRDHTGAVNAVAVSPARARGVPRFATAGADGLVKLWDGYTDQPLLTITAGSAAINDIAFSPNGDRLATVGDDGHVKLWDIADIADAAGAPPLFDRADHNAPVIKVAFNPDGATLVTSGYDARVITWSLAPAAFGERQFALSNTDPKQLIQMALAFPPSAVRLATSDVSGKVTFWNMASRQPGLSWSADDVRVFALAFSPNGRQLVTGGWQRTALWDSVTREESSELTGHTAAVRAVSFSADGKRVATGSDDHRIKVWDVATGQEELTLAGHQRPVSGVAFLPVARGTVPRLVSVSTDGTARIWNVGLSEELLTVDQGEVIDDLVFAPDGKTVTVLGESGTVKRWDLATGQRQVSYRVHRPNSPGSAGFSADGKRLAFGLTTQPVTLWDVSVADAAAKGSKMGQYTGQDGIVYHTVSLNADGTKVAVGLADKSVEVWDLEDDKRLWILTGHEDVVHDFAFSADGAYYATVSSDHTAKIWDATSGNEVKTFSGHSDQLRSLAFSPDSQQLATASVDGTAKVWDLHAQDAELTLIGHTSRVTSIAYSPDGRQLVTTSGDGTAKLWNADNGENLLTLNGHRGEVRVARFSPDGRQIISGGEDQTVRLYTLELADLLALARQRITRSLTPAECQRYLREASC